MDFLHPKIFGAGDPVGHCSQQEILRLCLLKLKCLDSANVQLNQVASKNDHCYCSSLLFLIKHSQKKKTNNLGRKGSFWVTCRIQSPSLRKGRPRTHTGAETGVKEESCLLGLLSLPCSVHFLTQTSSTAHSGLGHPVINHQSRICTEACLPASSLKFLLANLSQISLVCYIDKKLARIANGSHL